jgi:hypothetical protein
MWCSGSRAGAECAVQEPVDDLIDKERVDLVSGAVQVIGDPHEILDDRRDLLDGERDTTLVGSHYRSIRGS